MPFGGYIYFKKRLLLRCIHHFESDLIYNMGHMHINVTMLWTSGLRMTYIKKKNLSMKIFDFRMKSLFFMIRGAFSIFCPFAFKTRSTTLIFVVCLTFRQTSLHEDVHKVSAVFTGHKLCFWYVFECTPHILKYSRCGLTLTLKLPA